MSAEEYDWMPEWLPFLRGSGLAPLARITPEELDRRLDVLDEREAAMERREDG